MPSRGHRWLVAAATGCILATAVVIAVVVIRMDGAGSAVDPAAPGADRPPAGPAPRPVPAPSSAPPPPAVRVQPGPTIVAGADPVLLEYGADGGWLLTGDYEGAVRVWDTGTGEEVTTLTYAAGGLGFPADMSPDGAMLAAQAGGRIVVWDVRAGGEPVAVLPADLPDVFGLAVGPGAGPAGGSLTATGHIDGSVRLWRGEVRHATLDAHPDLVSLVVLSPDGTRLVTADTDSDTPRLWDTTDGALVAELFAHIDEVNVVGFSADGSRLATAGSDGLVQIWDGRTGAPTHALQADEEWLAGLALHPDATAVAATGNYGVGRIWDLTVDPVPEPVMLNGVDAQTDLIFCDHPGLLLTLERVTGALSLWDRHRGTLLAVLVEPPFDIFGEPTQRLVAARPDCAGFAVAGPDGTVELTEIVLSTSTGPSTSTGTGTGGDGGDDDDGSDGDGDGASGAGATQSHGSDPGQTHRNPGSQRRTTATVDDIGADHAPEQANSQSG